MATAPPIDPAPSSPNGVPAGRGGGRLAFMLRAFRHRNYRLFFFGQIVSLVGTFMSQLTVVWLVYHLSNKVWVVGVTGFAAQFPMFALAPFGGVWADRMNRHRLIVVTQVLSMLQSFALAAVAFSPLRYEPLAGVVAIVALAVFQGMVNAIDIPARQAFLVEMVTDRNDLANAIALNSTMVHAARLIGPAAAGLLIYYVGPGWCFLIDGFSYLAVIAALLAMTVIPRALPPPRSVMHELKEGFAYVWGFTPIRVLLIVTGVLSLAGIPAVSVLMPVVARYFVGVERDSQVFGFLMAASGVGALSGAIYLASRRSVAGLGRVIVFAAGGMGLGLIAFGLSRRLPLSMAIVAVIGLGMIVNVAAANTVLQTVTEERMRGRVMSFFSMAFLGMAPFGNLIAGWLAHVLGGRWGDAIGGASRTVMICGAVCIIAGAWFGFKLSALRQLVRPIYEEKGILPRPVASGLQTATDAVAAPEG